MSGNFFPPEYKSSYYREGDVVAYPTKEGKFALARILKIDIVNLSKGQSIGIKNEKLTVTEDDSMLVLGVSTSEPVFKKFEDSYKAFEKRALKISKKHEPIRTTGLNEKCVLLGNYPVADAELEVYKKWKEAFKKGEAGVL